jgi:hypothetical protein
MAVLRKIFGTSIAIAVALAVSGPSSAFAQEGGAAPATPAQGGPGAGAGGGGQGGGRGGRGGGPTYTPAPGAKDLKAGALCATKDRPGFRDRQPRQSSHILALSLIHSAKGMRRPTRGSQSSARFDRSFRVSWPASSMLSSEPRSWMSGPPCHARRKSIGCGTITQISEQIKVSGTYRMPPYNGLLSVIGNGGRTANYPW